MLLGASALTCDASEALAPPGSEDIVLVYVGDSVFVSGERSAIEARAEVNGKPLAEPRLRFTSSDSNIVAVIGIDSLIARNPGMVSLAIRLESAILPRSGIEVIQPMRVMVADLRVSPRDTTLTSLGDATTLRVLALDLFGDQLPPIAAMWSSSDTTVVSVDSRGRVLARTAGSALLRATIPSDGVTATAIVRVINPPVTLDIPAAAMALGYVGDTATVPVELRNARGDLLDPASIVWSSLDDGIVRVMAGLITARDTGVTRVIAMNTALGDTLADTLRVSVTNDAVRIRIVGPATDTLTAPGQSRTYSADVLNDAGVILPGYSITWRSTNTAVDMIAPSGTATTVAYGSALLIARAGNAEDTIAVTVFNPSRVVVDNSVTVPPAVGTLARPFSTIMAAVAFADAGDTVIVRRGLGSYPEEVVLTRRVTLRGDDSAFVANGRDPLYLPLIAHDQGSAAIRGSGSVAIVIRNLAIRHTVDGFAIETDGADVSIENVFVNPGNAGFAIGHGISIRNVPAVAILDGVVVRSVRGYGIRLSGSNGVRVTNATVELVAPASGMSGAGIEIAGSPGAAVSGARVRGTAGPQVLFSSVNVGTLAGSDLAGEHQLIRISGGAGTVVTDNLLDTRRQPGESFDGNSETDGRSALEIGAPQITVRQNVFLAHGGAVSRMDAVRMIDARGGIFGVHLDSNTFSGGRYAVRSERSSWTMTGGRVDSAFVGALVTAGDSAAIEGSTMASLSGGCIVATSARVRVAGSIFDSCGSLGVPGITITGGSIDLGSSIFRGSAGRVVRVESASSASLRGNAVTSPGGPTGGATGLGALDVTAGFVEAVGNSVTGFAGHAGIAVSAISARVDSNRVALNQYGLRFGPHGVLTARDNDIFDNDLAGAVNDDSDLVSIPGNWWGDGRGMEGGSDADAVGDSVIGRIAVTPVALVPAFPGAGTAAMRMVRGDGQTGPEDEPLPQALTVRVVDSEGRPVAGATVTFSIESGGSNADFENGNNSIIRDADASGLAEAHLTISRRSTDVVVRATASGSSNSVTFSTSSQ